MPKYIKPTLKTKFHIDFNWWAQEERNFHRVLLDQLEGEYRATIEVDSDIRIMDWIDPETAQVFSIDQLWHVIHTQCGQNPDFLSERLPLATAIFRLFIINNNTPLTAAEIHQQLQRKTPSTILRTIGGRSIYHGIRPVIPLIA